MQKILSYVILILLIASPNVHGEKPVITSFSGNGQLIFNETTNAINYTVEWAPSPAGPWTNSWEQLKNIPAMGSGSITSSIPMFFRVAANNTPSDLLDFESLNWVYGGFNGSKVSRSDVVISNLSMTPDDIYFRYNTDLTAWGVSDPDDWSHALSCLFVKNNSGQWLGGKINWISSNRTSPSRDYDNINEGYIGWTLDDVPNPCEAAFVIVDVGGQKRSNVITATWNRTSPSAGDMVPYGALNWTYGGFKCSGASHSGVSISGLSMNANALSFKYDTDLSAWGVSHGDYNHALACMFVKNNAGQWVGGKMDWISSSRTSRDYHNVYGGYVGWTLHDVPNPCEAAFVIVHTGGKKRSNVITTTWRR